MPSDPNPDSCHEEPGPPGAIGREGHHHHNDLGSGLLSTTSERPERSFWRPQLNCWQLGVGGPGVFCFYFSDLSTPITLRSNAISLHTSPIVWNVPCGIPREARTANFQTLVLEDLKYWIFNWVVLVTFQSVEFFIPWKLIEVLERKRKMSFNPITQIWLLTCDLLIPVFPHGRYNLYLSS